MAEYQIKIFPSIESIPKEKWNSLNPSNFPFQKYEFHHALEKSQSIGDTRGQWPFYITVWHEEDLVGALASYLKNHSYGEYIFDWEIANFFQMNQIQYYPKLVSYTPYTPAVGPKIMCSSSDVEKLLIDSLSELAKKTKCPSYSFLFLDDNDRNILKKGNYPLREYSQFFWHNHGLKDFEDFLLSLDSRKAKQIRRERRGVSEQGLKIQSLQGDMITDEHAEIFYKLYINTMNKKGSFDYLTKEFFHQIFHSLKNQILLHFAYDQDENLVAGTLNFFDKHKLYGRYWGSFKDFKFLHFELCYYLNIDFAIANQLKVVEAGAQGQHKIPRGFVPEKIYSSFNFFNQNHQKIIENYFEEEKDLNNRQIEELKKLLPFKK